MNQILDRTSSKKNNNGPKRNPKDTPKIIKVYAALMILFALSLIGLGGYAYYDNNLRVNNTTQANPTIPTIELLAKDDKVTINVNAMMPVENVRYQWYTGTRTVEDIHKYNDSVPSRSDSSELEEVSSDEDIDIEEEEMLALGKSKDYKGVGEATVSVPNIGIPRGTNTLHITVKLQGTEVITEFVKTYTTDVGVDQIAPTVKAYFWSDANDPKLIVIAKDETEIKNAIYSIHIEGGQGEEDISVTERVDSKTIRAEVPLVVNEYNEVTISAVDKASNTAEPEVVKIDLIKGKPEIVEFTAETDFSKVYAVARFARGIKKTEYIINNGQPVVKEYEDLPKQVVIEIPTVEGSNHIVVRAYAEKEELYGEDYGDCEYHPQN